jgi:hypothetical protein
VSLTAPHWSGNFVSEEEDFSGEGVFNTKPRSLKLNLVNTGNH